MNILKFLPIMCTLVILMLIGVKIIQMSMGEVKVQKNGFSQVIINEVLSIDDDTLNSMSTNDGNSLVYPENESNQSVIDSQDID